MSATTGPGFCATCIYAEAIGPSQPLSVVCRRRAPPYVGDNGEAYGWPARMDRLEWCGEGRWIVQGRNLGLDVLELVDVRLRERQSGREQQRLVQAEEREQARQAEREGRAPPRRPGT